MFAVPVAILDALKEQRTLVDTILYTTLYPSYKCAQMICDEEIPEVVYWHDNNKRHHVTQIEVSKEILERSGIKIRWVISYIQITHTHHLVAYFLPIVFYYNYGWVDYGVPTLTSLLDMVKVMDFALEEGKVAVHCHAGLGRTGVLVACYLAYSLRLRGDEVIARVREKRYVEPFFGGDPSQYNLLTCNIM